MHQRSALAIIDVVLVRGLVPLWVLAGAVFKLIERTPGNLPSVIRDMAWELGRRDLLNPFMRAAIGVEIVAVALMVLVPRLSRTVAICILTLFCAILAAELYKQSGSCGCLGAVKMHPGVMMAIDGAMLAGAIALGAVRRKPPMLTPEKKDSKASSMGLVTALAIGVVGFIVAIAVPERTVQEPPVQPDEDQQVVQGDSQTPPTGNGQSATPTPPTPPPSQDLPPNSIANPNPTPLPGYYMPTDPQSWVGKNATDVDLIKLMRIWPDDIRTGDRHIIFYSRTCDHCEMMFLDHLILPQDRPVTVVEVPHSRDRKRGAGAWNMPEVDVQQLSLPLGSDWLMTPPLIITIDEGVVTCAQESSYENCLGVEPLHEH